MAVKPPTALQKTLYGGFFVVALPVLLIFWARASQAVVPLPPVHAPGLGLTLGAAGAALMVFGMAALWRYGGGLPMNLAPPPQFVADGIYRLLPHPIYTGFCLLCVGASLATSSASGLWLVSPVAILGCTALVLGYERQDLRRRFGEEVLSVVKVLPADTLHPPTAIERWNTYLCVLFPWVLLYEAVVILGIPPDATSAFLPFENRLRVWEWTEVFYASCYPIAAFAPFAAKTARDLRRFAVQGLLAMAVAFPLYLLLPLIAEPRSFSPQTPLGVLLTWERTLDAPVAAFPSFHVIWAVLAAAVWAGRKPALAWVWGGWAILVAASCVTTGMHAIVDVLGGFLTIALVARAPFLWSRLRDAGERVANSLTEWRVGRVRIFSHSLYAGAAGFAGLWLAATLAGPQSGPAILAALTGGLVGAGLWAQFVEGSPALLRPFGYFGAVIGAAASTLLAPLFGASTWVVLASIGAAAPWAQAIGRLRCLAQGCCHGRPAPKRVGIAYFSPLSRVSRLTEWRGVPLHPTPVYSILWNIVVGLILARLWSLHAELNLLVGVYFILSGVGRFVEEGYRGEPQTPLVRRLPIYQWTAIGLVLAGALLTALGPVEPAPVPALAIRPALIALAFGVLCWFAYGVDFPDSNRRFARLA